MGRARPRAARARSSWTPPGPGGGAGRALGCGVQPLAHSYKSSQHTAKAKEGLQFPALSIQLPLLAQRGGSGVGTRSPVPTPHSCWPTVMLWGMPRLGVVSVRCVHSCSGQKRPSESARPSHTTACCSSSTAEPVPPECMQWPHSPPLHTAFPPLFHPHACCCSSSTAGPATPEYIRPGRFLTTLHAMESQFAEAEKGAGAGEGREPQGDKPGETSLLNLCRVFQTDRGIQLDACPVTCLASSATLRLWQRTHCMHRPSFPAPALPRTPRRRSAGPAASQDAGQWLRIVRQLSTCSSISTALLRTPRRCPAGPAASQDAGQRMRIVRRLSDIHLEAVGVLDKIQRG